MTTRVLERGQQKLGPISPQASPYLRFLLVEAGQSVARHHPEMRKTYQCWAMRGGRAKAKVAVARNLEVKLCWKLRDREQEAQRAVVRPAGGPESFPGAPVKVPSACLGSLPPS